MLETSSQDMVVTTRPFAFSSPEYVTVPMGATILEIVRNIHAQAGVPASWQSSAIVMVNGEIITPDRWQHLIPAAGANVVVNTSLHGGGDGKNPLRTILTIVVLVVATYVSGGMAAGSYGAAFGAGGTLTTAGALASAAITVAGMMLVNAIAPIRPPTLQGLASRDSAESPTYSLSGGQNDIRRFGVVPVVLGRHQMTPPLGAMSYTEILGNDEYLRMLVVWGYGPLQIRNILIGETPITKYKDVEIQTVEGRSTDPALSLFPRDVYQDQIGTSLTAATGWVQRTSQPNANGLSVDIVFNGLTVFNDLGNKTPRTVEIELRYRKVGDVAWTTPVKTVTKAAQTLDVNAVYGATSSYGIYVDKITGAVSYVLNTSPVVGKLLIGSFHWSWGDDILEVTNYNAPDTTGFVVSYLTNSSIAVTAGTITTSILSTTRATAQVVRVGHKWNVDNGYQYEVALRRVTADSTDSRTIDACVWTTLRTIQVGSPINFRQPLAMTAIRIKATEQLSGVISNLNATVTSYANIWNGTDWNTVAPTNNPAALMRLVLMGPANDRRRTTAQVDQDNLAEFYTHCATNGYAFNMVRDYVSSVWSTCSDIAAAGRASVTINNGKWGVVMDVADRPVRQHFTPRNSWSFESTKMLSILPHAWRVRFVNEDEKYKQDERIVYADGYNASNATRFEGIEFPGVTDPALVWKFGRFHLAQLELRPEEYGLTCGMEHLACQRGDLILANHDVTMWGLGSGRVKELVMDGADIVGVVVDEAFVMEDGTSYNVRFRLDDGTSYIRTVYTVAGENTELVFTEIATGNIHVGDLAMFGELGTETQRLLVKGIARGDNLSAKLILVDESPAIYTADTGAIPDHVTNITTATNLTEIPPDVPSITSVQSGTSALLLVGTSLISRILVGVASSGGNVKVGSYQIRYRETDNIEWLFASITGEETTVIIWPVQDGAVYEIQASASNEYGASSDWSDVVYHTVVGQSEVPPNVTGISVNVVGTEAHISWDVVSIPDFSHYQIRWSPVLSGASWGASVIVGEHIDGTSTSLPAQVGTYLVKAFDRMGNESATAASAITNIAKLAGLNVVQTVTEQNPTWPGVKDGVYYDANIGGIILDAAGDLYDSLDLYAEANLYSYGGMLSEGYYYFSAGIDLGAVFTSRVSGSQTVSGVDFSQDLYDPQDLYALVNLYGQTEGKYSSTLEVRTTSDDPDVTPTWSAWMPLIVGDYTARAFEGRIKLVGDGLFISPVISSGTGTVDMPDRVYRFSADILSGGTRVVFDPAFYVFTNDEGLGISVIDGAEGDNYTITNLDSTGFDIAFTNGGSPVARRISGIAQSYGEVSA